MIQGCNIVILAAALAAAAGALAQTPPAAETGAALAVRQAADGSYRFDTGVLRGSLGVGSKAGGLTDVVFLPTGKSVSGLGLLSYYRVFSAGKRFRDLRGRPAQFRLLKGGALEVRWPADKANPFAVTAVYRCVRPDVIDVETSVKADAALPGFEVFLGCYFSKDFPAACFPVRSGAGGAPEFISAEERDGVWQVFPRDDAALAVINDGRWKRAPNAVDWSVRPPYAIPLVYRAHRSMRLTGVFMTEPDGCFAAFAPQRGESHFSQYFSLFGSDLKPGETARTRSRLVILHGAPEARKILDLWREFSRPGN